MDEIFRRRSVRSFTDERVTEEDMLALMEAAMSAPSAMNQHAWEFMVVDDPGLIARLSTVSPYAKPAGAAPLCIVPLGVDPEMRVPHMWEQDMGAVTENILLMATSLELGTCWIGISPHVERMAAIRDILGIPGDRRPFCIIAVGHPEEPLVGRPSRMMPERVHRNCYRSLRQGPHVEDPVIARMGAGLEAEGAHDP